MKTIRITEHCVNGRKKQALQIFFYYARSGDLLLQLPLD